MAIEPAIGVLLGLLVLHQTPRSSGRGHPARRAGTAAQAAADATQKPPNAPA
jgi:hypothetical protein